MVALLARTRGPDDVVVVLGGSGDASAAASLGLSFERRVTPALGCGTLAWARLRVLETRGAFAGIEAVHAWSLGALAAARLGLSAALRAATTCTVSVPPTPRSGAGVAAAILEAFAVGAAQRCPNLRFSSVSVRDAWASRFGLAAAAASTVPIAPGIERMSPRDFEAASGSDRAQALQRWGVAPGERVLLALADHAPLIDARRFIFHCGVMAVGGHRLVGVVPPGAAQLERAVRFTRRHHGAWRLVIDDSPMPQLIALADAAMPASPFCEWSAAFARRSGVRVVDPIEATGDRLAANAALLRTLEAVPAGV
jgi:hypothetical protein